MTGTDNITGPKAIIFVKKSRTELTFVVDRLKSINTTIVHLNHERNEEIDKSSTVD